MTWRDHLLSTSDSSWSLLGIKTWVTGVATTGVGWVTASNVAAIGGLAIAFVGLLIQWWFKLREDRRLRRLREAQERLALLRIERITAGDRV